MKKTGGVFLFIVNVFSTIVTILFYRLFSGLAFAFGPPEDMEKATTTITILFLIFFAAEILKWISYYFVIIDRKKSWLLFYLAYTIAIFFVSIEHIHILFVFVVLYTIALMYVHQCLEDEEEEGKDKEKKKNEEVEVEVMEE